METLLLETGPGNDLAGALLHVATDPAKVKGLHEILGGFCHQCRNLLNSLKLSLYLARRGDGEADPSTWSELEARYLAVERLFDRLQAICRPMTVTPVRVPLRLLLDERRAAWAGAMAGKGRGLTLVPPDGPDVGDFDPVRLGEALDAFVLWRARAGGPGRPATLAWGVRDDRVHLDWDEPEGEGGDSHDGPDERDDSLALPLLARVVAAHGGCLTVDDRSGLSVLASWPATVAPSRTSVA